MVRTAMAAGLAVAMGLGGVTSANAGLLDFIFGWRDRTDVPKAVAPPRFAVTVPAPARKVPRAKPKAPKAAPQLAPAEILARTIDPVRNPNWWLDDPTLRKGDILVLTDRVLVFAGRRLGAPNSYAALSETKLLSRKDRLQVAMMTGHSHEPPMLADRSGPRQPKLLKSASLGAPVQPLTLGAPRS